MSNTNKEINNTSEDFKTLLQDHPINLPKIGDVVSGKVVSVSNNEVRIDIDGIAVGVVRGYEVIDESGEYSDLSIGDEVSATVLDLDNENGEMELSFRSAGHKKAWQKLDDIVKNGEIVQARIVDANKGGLMVSIGKINGFLPVSQLCPEHYPRVQGGDKGKILEKIKSYIGSDFEVKIIDANEAEEKLIVSEKAAWEEKQQDVISSYKVGDVIEGTVTVVTDFGVFVKFGNQLEGLVHISELAWQRIDDPKGFVKPGEKIKAEIIKIEGSKIFLSMKKLVDDPWKNVAKKYNIGQKVVGKVLKVNPFGLFVELDDDIHGLAHVSELSNSSHVDPEKIASPGDEVEFKIISIEPTDHRLGLSIKALKEKEVKPETVNETKEEKEKTE